MHWIWPSWHLNSCNNFPAVRSQSCQGKTYYKFHRDKDLPLEGLRQKKNGMTAQELAIETHSASLLANSYLHCIIFTTRYNPPAIRCESNSIHPSCVTFVSMDAILPSYIPYLQISVQWPRGKEFPKGMEINWHTVWPMSGKSADNCTRNEPRDIIAERFINIYISKLNIHIKTYSSPPANPIILLFH